MHRGYVKLWRKILDWEWFTSSETFHIFAYLFLAANHSDGNYKGIEVKRGQLLTGRKTLSEKTGISERTIRTSLKRLKSTGEITIKSTNKYTIITLCNYDTYNYTHEQSLEHSDDDGTTDEQNTEKRPADRPAENGLYSNENHGITLYFDQQSDQQSDQQVTSNRPASDQQVTTNKNDKNEKNEKNEKNKKIDTVHMHSICNASAMHMGTRNRNENRDKNSNEKLDKSRPRTFDEFKSYCEKNGYGNIAERAFRGYEEADWHDSKGKKIKNWKQKLQHVWFSDKNRDKIDSDYSDASHRIIK